MNKRIVLMLLALALMLPGSAFAFKCIPLYGNWCGIDYPPAGRFPPPIDEFDAACMKHDFCTGGSFFGKKYCDKGFSRELRYLRWKYGYLPRPLRWAEYLLRIKTGGSWKNMPMPKPGDPIGALRDVLADCD